MRYRMPVLAAGALAAALAFGPSPATQADPLPKLNDFFVADSTPNWVLLIADASPELVGAPADVLFGENPFQGVFVGGTQLKVGPNAIRTPNFGAGWFTVIGPFKASSTPFDRLPDEN